MTRRLQTALLILFGLTTVLSVLPARAAGDDAPGPALQVAQADKPDSGGQTSDGEGDEEEPDCE